MLGIVNQAVEDMARSLGGEPLWRRIAEGAGLDPDVGILRMESYPDELTLALVESASEVLGMSCEQVLEEFGKHWILYTAESGYGQLLNSAGHDLTTFGKPQSAPRQGGSTDAKHTLSPLQLSGFGGCGPAPDLPFSPEWAGLPGGGTAQGAGRALPYSGWGRGLRAPGRQPGL